jgi:hypothetical protein
MADAETTEKIPKLTRARLFRNGLMIALLACCPIRLKNYIALEIGRSFVRSKTYGGLFSRHQRPRNAEPMRDPHQRSSMKESIGIFACTGQFY